MVGHIGVVETQTCGHPATSEGQITVENEGVCTLRGETSVVVSHVTFWLFSFLFLTVAQSIEGSAYGCHVLKRPLISRSDFPGSRRGLIPTDPKKNKKIGLEQPVYLILLKKSNDK